MRIVASADDSTDARGSEQPAGRGHHGRYRLGERHRRRHAVGAEAEPYQRFRYRGSRRKQREIRPLVPRGVPHGAIRSIQARQEARRGGVDARVLAQGEDLDRKGGTAEQPREAFERGNIAIVVRPARSQPGEQRLVADEIEAERAECVVQRAMRERDLIPGRIRIASVVVQRRVRRQPDRRRGVGMLP